MGLFSSKKKVKVNTAVSPIYEEFMIPNSPLSGTVSYALFDAPLADSIIEELSSNIGVRSYNLYSWAKREYKWGTPSSRVVTRWSAQSIVKLTLNSLWGPNLTFNYYSFGPLNSIHYAWKRLQDDYGYDPNTNLIASLSASIGYDVYLKDMVPVFTQETVDNAVNLGEMYTIETLGVLANAGPIPENMAGNPNAVATPYEVSETATANTVTVHYQYAVPTQIFIDNEPTGIYEDVITNGTLVLSLENEEEDADYHQVRYTNTNGESIYFTYRDGSGTYPDIDAVFDSQANKETLGNFMPWIYLRWDFVNESHKKAKTSSLGPALQILKDRDLINDLPTDFEENNTEFNEVQLSLYAQYSKLCKLIGLDYQTLSDALHKDQNTEDIIQSFIAFGVKGKGKTQVELEYMYRYVDALFSNQSPGSPSGIVGSPFGIRSYTQLIEDRRFSMAFTFSGLSRQVKTGRVAKVGKYAGGVEGFDGVYRKQITSTTYIEVTIFNPTVRYNILGKYGHSDSIAEDEFRMPLDRTVMLRMSLVNREELLARALHLVVNTYVEIKEKWYSRSWFKWVMIIVAIVITVLSFGAAWQSIVAAAAIGTVAVAVVILKMVLVAVISQLAIKAFINVAGLENSFFAAILAVVASYFVPSGSTIGNISTAQTLMQVGTNLATQVGKGFTDAIKDIQEEMEAFKFSAEEKMEELEEVQYRLASETNFLDSLLFTNFVPQFVYGEDPQDYYARTVHSGNIGVLTIQIQKDFIKQSLTLPTLSDSVKDLIEEGRLL